MNLKKFNNLWASFPANQFGQEMSEWRFFLEFASAYFEARDIIQPLVVEIGIWNGYQRRFYEAFLNARYIGIDIEPKFHPDILGDSHSAETVRTLKEHLAGRAIDLLFIDGDHSYQSVKTDYLLYDPLVTGIIAFHDIYKKDEAEQGAFHFWNDIMENNKRPLVAFKKDSMIRGWMMGIGLIMKAD
jgi:hypothetical protein